MNRPITVVSLTEPGKLVAQALAYDETLVSHWHRPTPFTEKVQQAFTQGHALILICATGIAVRTLAPVLQSKYDDPPVIVIDEQANFVIPLLSGHEGGANNWAAKVAETLEAQLVLTTATSYVNPVYAVGMGCERGCSQQHLHEVLMQGLEQINIRPADVISINSIQLKSDELGLIALARELNVPFQVFSAEQLNTKDDQLSCKSDYVFNTVGVYGVAESAALFAASAATGTQSELVLNKIKSTKATCAIARSYGGTDKTRASIT